MTTDAREIERKALSLSASEREMLANHLFHSFHNQKIREIDEAWLLLAAEKWNTYQENPESGIEKNAFFSDPEFSWMDVIISDSASAEKAN
jgi:hypothetical protein